MLRFSFQALFGLQDDKTKWSLTVPLSPEQLAWWQERMRKTIFHVRHVFPDARIVLRNLHRTDDVVAGTQYITNCACLRLLVLDPSLTFPLLAQCRSCLIFTLSVLDHG